MRISNPLPYLDIHTTNAVINIENDPLRLRVNSQPARMHVTHTQPSFKVNWKKLAAESGVKNPAAMRRYVKMRHQQLSRQHLGKMMDAFISTDDQNYLPQGTMDAAAAIMRQNTSDFDLADMTSTQSLANELTHIEWEPGSLEIEWEPHSLEMSWEGDLHPRITVTPHTVEIRLIDGNTVRVGENEAKAIEMQGYGKRVDTKV